MPSHPIAALALAAVSVTSAVEAQSLARWFVDGQRGADIASNGRTKTAPWKTIAYALSRIPPVTNPRNWQTLEVCGGQVYSPSTNGETLPITPTYNLFLEGTLNNAPPVIRIPSGGVGLRFSPAISYSRNPSTVRYLRFEGGDYGIEIGASTTHRHRPRVQDCIFSGQAKAGVRVRDSQGGTDPRFFQNEFMNGPVGIEVDGSYRGGVIAPDIDECFFHDLSMAGITVRDANSGSFEPPINACRFWNSPIGVDIETSGSTFDQTTIKVSRSTFHTMSRHGVRLNAAKLGNGRLEILDSSFHRSGTAIALTGTTVRHNDPYRLSVTRSTIDGGSIGLHVAVDGNATIAIENSDNLIRRTTTGMLFEHANTSATTTCSVQSTNDRLLENSTGALFRMNRGSGSIEIDSAIVARNRSRGLETRSTTHRVTVRSATFADNGIGTYGRYSSTQRFSHCAFGGNSTDTVSAYPSAFTYCCFERGSVSGTGNLNRTDPQLVRPFYKLSPNSPCVDAGSTTASLPPTDYEGDPRKSVGRANGPFRADIGADEYIYGGTSRSYGTPGFAEFGCFPEMAREQVSCRIGATLRIDLDGAWYPFFRVPCRSATLAIGAQDDSGSRLPFELSSLGARGSMLWTDTLYLSGPIRVGGTGTATATLRIPNSTRLVGMTICAQWAVLTDRMNVATSDGLRATFGR